MALAKADRCTGCGVCSAICVKQAISMQKDSFGFFHPQINATYCIQCGLCDKFCPVCNSSSSSGLINAFAVNCLNDSIRQNSSSGGFFPVLAKSIIHSGGVVYGAAYGDHMEVVHIRIEEEKDIKKLQGAKYVQTSIVDCFSRIMDDLRQGRWVLFSGTPCQVAAVDAVIKEHRQQLVLVDFICHGVPSPKAWRSWLEYRAQQDKSNPQTINQRCKKHGWHHYAMSITYNNRRPYIRDNHYDPFLQAFVKNLTIRNSCTDCAFKGIERVSDITLGDLWGMGDFLPEMFDDKGTTAVLLHSEKAEQLFEKIKDEILYRPVNIEAVIKWNLSISESAQKNLDRDHFLSMPDWHEMDVKLLEKQRKERVQSIIPSIKNKARQLIKNVVR